MVHCVYYSWWRGSCEDVRLAIRRSQVRLPVDAFPVMTLGKLFTLTHTRDSLSMQYSLLAAKQR